MRCYEHAEMISQVLKVLFFYKTSALYGFTRTRLYILGCGEVLLIGWAIMACGRPVLMLTVGTAKYSYTIYQLIMLKIGSGLDRK